MLRSLHIKNFVIVDQLDLQFTNGFTVLTGETGAGKSILIDALILTLGGRSDPQAIREGQNKTEISAVFECPASLNHWVSEQEIDDDQLVLRRIVDRSGKNKAFINGMPVTLTQLREVSEYLIDIHGQHAHQTLLKSHTQRDILDSHGGHEQRVTQVQSSWKQWKAALKTWQQATQNASFQEATKERITWQLEEIERLQLIENEWQTINQEYNCLAYASSLLEGASQTLILLDGEHKSLISELAAASQRITKLAQTDKRLENIYEALQSAHISCSEAASDLASYVDKIELDPIRLDVLEKRMQQVFDVAKKLKKEPEDLLVYHAQLKQELMHLTESKNIATLEKAIKESEQNYLINAKALSVARKKTALLLSKTVSQAMQTLAMQGGQFEIALLESEPSINGLEVIEFRVAGHAGVTPRALSKVASGGELARISLALSVMSGKAKRVPTLIFDEVDTGIGGAVAEVVGRLLQTLGVKHQVLCVTHLPQVAACANNHFQVHKHNENNTTTSTIKELTKDERTNEIARMLGGIKITKSSLNHAQEMLKATPKFKT